MNGAVFFGCVTVVHASFALVAGLYLEALLLPALCFATVELVTAFDNGVTAFGNRLGERGLTRLLSRGRFFLHAVCIGLLVPVYGGIAGAVALGESGAEIITALSWVLATLIALYGYVVQYRSIGELQPVRVLGCLRYGRPGHMPWASIAVTLVGLIISLLIGWRGQLWVPFIVTALMFIAPAFQRASWGPVATSALEVVFSAGLLFSLSVAAAR